MPKLKLTDYEPNMSDPRVRRRFERVLEYTRGMVDHDVQRNISAKELRRLFGNYTDQNNESNNNHLAVFLFSNLMRQVGGYQRYVANGSDSWPKAYEVKKGGYAKLRRLLDSTI